MTYRLRLSGDAARYLSRLDEKTRLRVPARLHEIQKDPFYPRSSRPLANARQIRSARVGGLRQLLFVDRDELLVLVGEIGPRGQVDRRL